MKIADIKPDTIYLVDWNPNQYNAHGVGYVQTRKKIVPQLKNGWVWNGWKSIEPTKKDRLSVRPVIFVNDEWVFDLRGEHHTERGEWGQIQTRNILSEASVEAITADQRAQDDADRLAGYGCNSLAQEAFEFYADHLEQIRSSERVGYEHESHEQDLDDARILREFDSYRSLR